MNNILFSIEAEDDINAIYEYTLFQHGYIQADAYENILRQKIDLLADMSEMGVIVDGFPHYRRLIVENHIIFYSIKGKSILIVRILHASSDYLENLS